MFDFCPISKAIYIDIFGFSATFTKCPLNLILHFNTDEAVRDFSLSKCLASARSKAIYIYIYIIISIFDFSDTFVKYPLNLTLTLPYLHFRTNKALRKFSLTDILKIMKLVLATLLLCFLGNCSRQARYYIYTARLRIYVHILCIEKLWDE